MQELQEPTVKTISTRPPEFSSKLIAVQYKIASINYAEDMVKLWLAKTTFLEILIVPNHELSLQNRLTMHAPDFVY